MNPVTRSFQALLLILAFGLSATGQAALPDFTSIVEEAKNSVVNISTKTRAKRSGSRDFKIPEMPEGTPFGE